MWVGGVSQTAPSPSRTLVNSRGDSRGGGRIKCKARIGGTSLSVSNLSFSRVSPTLCLAWATASSTSLGCASMARASPCARAVRAASVSRC